jgi:aminopeptidase N
MIKKSAGLLSLAISFFFILPGAGVQGAMAEGNTRAYPEYDLRVSFDMKNNLIRGEAKINLHGPAEISLEGFRIISVSFNGQPFAAKSSGWLRIYQKGRMEIRYEKVFTGAFETSPLGEGALSGSMISNEGIYLTGRWYPRVKGLAVYRLKALVPAGFTAISEADEISFVDSPDGKLYSFAFSHPVPGIDLVAGNYVQTKGSFGDVDIYTYFFPQDQDLAIQYIAYTKKYIEMDDRLLVPYAYKRFSVVENTFPTGLSMPTFTLIGAQILRFPFVLDESLGHEITHQWFGNYVYADFEKGNWLEAITVYMSDYHYARLEGKGRQYRKRALVKYQSYVNSGNDLPLRKFYVRTGPASEAIGYGKGMMVFNMLERLLGKDVFYKSLKVFIRENEWKVATWDDIKRVFEKESGRDLNWFFQQWVERKGEGVLEVGKGGFFVSSGVPKVSVDIKQKGKPYRLNLNVKIFAGSKEIKSASILVDRPKQIFEWSVAGKPTSLVIDGDSEVMRRLAPGELPPVISRLLGSKHRIVVYQPAQKQVYASLLNAFSREGFTLKEEKDITDKDIRESSLLVVGIDSPILKKLFGKLERPAAGFVLTVRNNPLDPKNVVAIADAISREEVDLATAKIFHYGQYSTITFSAGRNTSTVTTESQKGIIRKIPYESAIVH